MQTKEQHQQLVLPRFFDQVFNQRYRLVNELGRGQFGTVYLCKDLEKNQDVAVKLLKVGGKSQEAINRVETECVLCQKLENPNVVCVLDKTIYKSPEYYGIVMELCQSNYKDLLAKGNGRPFEASQARKMVKAVASGLHYLKSNRIIHRDIALKNILIDQKGQTKIADFGLAVMMKPDLKVTTLSNECGTPEYMAPEMADHLGYSYPLDVWALGIALYYLLYGKSPYSGQLFDVKKISTTEMQFETNANVSALAVNLLKRMLDKEPRTRILPSHVLEHAWMTEEPPKVKRSSSKTNRPPVNSSIDSGRGISMASTSTTHNNSTAITSGASVRSNSGSRGPINVTPVHHQQQFHNQIQQHHPEYVEQARHMAAVASPHLSSHSIHQLSHQHHLSQIQQTSPISVVTYNHPPPLPQMCQNPQYPGYSQQKMMQHVQHPPHINPHVYPYSPEMMQPPQHHYQQQHHHHQPQCHQQQQVEAPLKKAKKPKVVKKQYVKPLPIILGSTLLADLTTSYKEFKISCMTGHVLALQLFNKGPNRESDSVIWLDVATDQIWTYYVRERGSGPNDPVPDKSKAINEPRFFTYATLPDKCFVYYNNLSNFYQVVLAKTPKVTIKSEIYKSVLYADGKFTMCVDPKRGSPYRVNITHNNNSLATSIIIDNVVYQLDDSVHRVPIHIVQQKCPRAQELVSLAHTMYHKCRRTEEFEESEWLKDPRVRPFPLIKGKLS